LPLRKPVDILERPLLAIEWSRNHRSPPTWAEWAASIGAKYRKTPGEVAFSLSSAAIDAAINGRGSVLLSMAGDDISCGRLVVPFQPAVSPARFVFPGLGSLGSAKTPWRGASRLDRLGRKPSGGEIRTSGNLTGRRRLVRVEHTSD
jgi:hypothetical protein